MPEIVKVSISHQPLTGVDLLPDVLRQLSAMIRLLTEFAADPKYSKIEVLSLIKQSDLAARLRVVTVKDAPKVTGKAKRGPIIRAQSAPFRRLERVFETAEGRFNPRSIDAEGLSALKDFAEQLKADVATIETDHQTMVVSSAIIQQINKRLGPIMQSHGRVTGLLEGLNIHARPWHFTIYPEFGPAKVRCFFNDGLMDAVRDGIGHVVTVEGVKDFVADSPWPLKIDAGSIVVKEEAKPGAWLDMAEGLGKLWTDADDTDKRWFLEEHIA